MALPAIPPTPPQVLLALANAWTATQKITGATTTSPDWEVWLQGDTFARIALGLNSTDVSRLSMGPGNGARDAFIERAGAANFRFGAPDAASPVAQVNSVQNVVAGTANTAGADRTFAGSQGTGSAAGGSILFKLAAAGGAGSAQNALATLMSLTAAGVLALVGLATITKDAIGATSTAGLTLANTTAAAAGAQQWSPSLTLSGKGWSTNSGGASMGADWRAEVIPVQGAAAPTSKVSWSSQINGGGFTERASLSSAGSFAATVSVISPALYTEGTTGFVTWFAGAQFWNAAGANRLALSGSAFRWGSGMQLGWSSATDSSTGDDVAFVRDTAGVVALRLSTAAQAFRVYNTWTDASNYERLSFAWGANVANIATEQAGSGTARKMALGTAGAAAVEFFTAGAARWQVNASGHLVAVSDNTLDIGALGATRPRYLYVGSAAAIPIVYTSEIWNSTASNTFWSLPAGATAATYMSGQTAPIMAFAGLTSFFPALKRSTTTLQVRLADDSAYAAFLAAAITATPAAEASALTVTGYSLSGSAASAMLNLAGTWNTSGNPVALSIAITNTASGATSKFLSFLAGASGTTEVLSVGKNGRLGIPDNAGGSNAPDLYFLNDTGMGVYRAAANIIGLSVNTNESFGGGTTGVRLPSGAALNWTNGSMFAGTIDLSLFRDIANTLAQRNGANAQTLRVYNTTDAGITNYERGFMRWNTSVFEIGVAVGGTGTSRAMQFLTNDTARWNITTAGHFIAATDNTYDIGASVATRPRNVYVAGFANIAGDILGSSNINVAAASLVYWTGRTIFSSPADGQISFRNNAGSGFDSMLLGPSGTTYNRIKHNSTGVLELRLADDSAQATWDALAYRVAATKVVGAQGAAVADASGGAIIDAEARSALNSLLARLRTHGLIAT